MTGEPGNKFSHKKFKCAINGAIFETQDLRSEDHIYLFPSFSAGEEFSKPERLLEYGVADYISMSRPFIREPGLINRWKAGDRRKAECISDSLCFRPGIKGEGIYCVVEKRGKTE